MSLAATVALAALVSPSTAQSTRVGALPASDVFSIRVTGDTLVAGTDTSVFVSTNGGLTWRGSSRPGPDAKTIDAVLLRDHRLFAGTFGTGVFESDDLGATWRPFNEGLVGGILDSQLDVSDLETRGDELFAATLGDGVFVRSLATLDTWHPFGSAFEPNQAANVQDLATDGTRLLASAGSNGTVFRRDPADADWTVSLLGNVALRPGLSALTAFFTGSGWVVGTDFGVFLSAQGTEPWTESSTRIPTTHGDAFAQVGSTLFGAFDIQTDFQIAQSTDGGATWTPFESVSNTFAYQLAAHGGDLYTARSDGLFVRAAATASVDALPRDDMLHFALAGPQPVHEAARFTFELPASARATLEIFDLAGRRAANPVEANLAAGAHEWTVDTRGFPAGVYLARLTSATRREALRLIRVD